MKTGFIGLGAMGLPMASNLADAGQLDMVWNRTAEKAAIFIDGDDVQVATSPVELANDCDLIITSVSADDDLREVFDCMLPALKPGTIIVDTSTVSVSTVRQLADELQKADVHLLDAPVSGGVEGARKATLVMMVGGDEEKLKQVAHVLKACSGKIVYMGKSGSGQAAKAVNQVMAAGINQAVTEALAFGQAMDLDMQKLINVISSGAAGNWFLEHRGQSMVDGVYEPGFKLALHHKDLGLCRSMMTEVCAGEKSLPMVEMTLIHYQRLMDQGFGDEDISSLFRLKQTLFDSD